MPLLIWFHTENFIVFLVPPGTAGDFMIYHVTAQFFKVTVAQWVKQAHPSKAFFQLKFLWLLLTTVGQHALESTGKTFSHKRDLPYFATKFILHSMAVSMASWQGIEKNKLVRWEWKNRRFLKDFTVCTSNNQSQLSSCKSFDAILTLKYWP